MLRYNSFRSKRFLRSQFVEGKYLLASEGTDIELELLDLYRTSVQSQLGDVAIEDGWKVERLSSSEILIHTGEAWFEGLPFLFRDYKDTQVRAGTGIGVDPDYITISDYPLTGGKQGKKLTFGALVAADDYRITIAAKEQRVTASQDKFLQNYNITETTNQKINLIYTINVLKVSEQQESPAPYTGTTTTTKNYSNYIKLLPTVVGQDGDVVSINTSFSTSQIELDGRNFEFIVYNPTGSFPISPTQQEEFSGGYLVDSKGSRYHIIAVYNHTVANQSIIRLDAEDWQVQLQPELVLGTPYYVHKKQIFCQNITNGEPESILYWPIADIAYTTSGVPHGVSINDLRTRIVSQDEYQSIINTKFGITPTKGGNIGWVYPNVDILSWSAAIELVVPNKQIQTIDINSIALVEAGSLVYELSPDVLGSIQRGNLSATIGSFGLPGTVVTFSPTVDLSDVRPGNILRLNTGSEIGIIEEIDVPNSRVTVSTTFTTTGAATIFKDSFGPGYAPIDENSYVLATRNGNSVYLADGTQLVTGELNRFGDGISQNNLTFIGAANEADSDPFYSYYNYFAQGTPLPNAISQLDNQLKILNDKVALPVYDERTLYPSGWYIADAKASLILQDLTYEADSAGPLGNIISIRYIGGGTAGSELVNVISTAITVQIEEGVSTANQIKTAVDAVPPAAALVDITVSGTGTNVQWTIVQTYLTGGHSQSAVIHIPVNSRNSGIQQQYDVESGKLIIFANQLLKIQGTGTPLVGDWYATDASGTEITTGATAEYIKFNYDQQPHTEVHFRMDTIIPNNGGSGGTQDLQDAYNLGNTITTTVGVPVSISGSVGASLLDVNGNMTVTGVIL